MQQRLINIMSSSGSKSKGKGKVTPPDINFDDWTIAQFCDYDSRLCKNYCEDGKGGKGDKGDRGDKGKGKGKKNMFRRFLQENEDFDSDADEDDFKEAFQRWCSLQK